MGSDSLRALSKLDQDQFQPWPFFWTRHDEARLVGPTLIMQDEAKRICLEAAYYELCLPHEPGYRYFKLPRPTRLDGNWTSLISQWTDTFHHWLMDALPRLAALPQFPADTRVLVPQGLLPYQSDTLRWLGLDGRVRGTRERHLVVEHFFFSSPTAMSGCYNPYAVNFLRRSFLKYADAAYEAPRRFYVQRLGKPRGLINEPEVVDFFKQHGWSIVDTEQLPMAQQVKLFAEADVICALHGAALTNLVWCRTGCKVLEICAANFLNGVYEGLAQAAGLDYRFLICEADASFRARVNMTELRRAVDPWLS